MTYALMHPGPRSTAEVAQVRFAMLRTSVVVAALCACSIGVKSPARSLATFEAPRDSSEPAASSATPPRETPAAASQACPRRDPLIPASPPALEDPSAALPNLGLAAELSRDASSRTYPAEVGAPLPPRDVGVLDDFWWGEPSVLDPDGDAGGERRVQFVCDRETYRVGFWLDARDLRPTNRSDTLLVARPKIPRETNEQRPGVRIPAGSALLPAPVGSGTATPAIYDDEDLIHADGYIATAVVDVVYKHSEQVPETLVLDGYLTGAAVDVRDAPRGVQLARLSLREPLAVTQLQRRGDAVLVRARGFDATVVGWVDGAQFEPRPRWTKHRPTKGGGGGVGRTGQPQIELEVGTLLVHEDSRHTLGVVTRTATFMCDGSCEAPEPRVLVMCGYELRLRAVRPDCAQ